MRYLPPKKTRRDLNQQEKTPTTQSVRLRRIFCMGVFSWGRFFIALETGNQCSSDELKIQHLAQSVAIARGEDKAEFLFQKNIAQFAAGSILRNI